jgi:subtilisin family serine protease
MYRTRHISAALAFATAALLPAAAWSQSDAAQRTVHYAKGRLLVQARPGLSDKEIDKLLKGHGAKRKSHIKQLNVYVVELPENASEVAIARLLRDNPLLESAEVDLAYPPELIPNDTYYGNAWHLPRIGGPAAWDASTGSGVTIAIMDSGVDPTHPDLVGQLVPGWNTYDNTSDTKDVYGHGTKVAGTAAATGSNAAGVAGVAWRARIMPMRVTDTSGWAYSSTLSQAITWAADHGARVANASFGGVAGSSTVQSAAQYMRSKGGVVVVAAGNSGVLESYAQSDALTVAGATDSNDAWASFSSFGPYVDVTAPGVNIWSTTNGGGYGGVSGTSFASPVTAGVYALMIAANPNLPPPTLDRLLFSTARDLGASGYDNYFGNGRVDAAAAVAAARAAVAGDTTAPSVSISSPTSGTVRGVVTVNASASDNVGVARVDLYVNGSLLATDSVAPYSFSWDTTGGPDGTVTLLARGYDAAGNYASSENVSVTVGNDTVLPTVAIGNPVNGATVSGTVSVTASAADNTKVARLSLLIDGREVAVAYGSTLSYTWNTGTAAKGKRKTSSTSTTITARAQDPAGNTGSASVTVRKQ